MFMTWHTTKQNEIGLNLVYKCSEQNKWFNFQECFCYYNGNISIMINKTSIQIY